MRTSQLICELHNEPIDVYCKNADCTSKIKICCNSCSQKLHQHQTTRINELKKDVELSMLQLKERSQKFQQFVKRIEQKITCIQKLIESEISYYQDIIENFDIKSKSILITAIKKMENQKKNELTEKINQFIKSQTDNSNNQQQKNTPDVDHLVLQYKFFLIDDNDQKQALDILNRILEIDKENFIYQREKDRLTRAIVEYSSADENFFSGHYQQAIEGYDKLLEKINDSRVHYQKGIALFYLQNYQEALKSIDNAIKCDTENIQYQITKSQLLYANNDLESLRIQSKNLKDLFETVNHNIEGQILLLQKENEKAQAEFEKAIQLNYFSFESHFFKALAISRSINSAENEIVKPQQIIQNNIDKQMIDQRNFNKFYTMYLKDHKQANNQMQLNPEQLKQFEQLLKAQKIKKQNQPNQPNQQNQLNQLNQQNQPNQTNQTNQPTKKIKITSQNEYEQPNKPEQ
ncbi:unnamed protein product [Paramecium sonneborni]|uniref:Tetratricopeptide repeat protein n=1 Tax=Paramecium sonneborni TaxID=65129 RepID=A0A8S1RAT5_9CILI|nr:unnamed protein product [Paramecium sonneborni]